MYVCVCVLAFFSSIRINLLCHQENDCSWVAGDILNVFVCHELGGSWLFDKHMALKIGHPQSWWLETNAQTAQIISQCISIPLPYRYFPHQLYLMSYGGFRSHGGTPKSSISMGLSIINTPFWGTPIHGKPPNLAVQQLSLGPLPCLAHRLLARKGIAMELPKLAVEDDFPIGTWHFRAPCSIQSKLGFPREATGQSYSNMGLFPLLRTTHQVYHLIPSLVGGSNPPEIHSQPWSLYIYIYI